MSGVGPSHVADDTSPTTSAPRPPARSRCTTRVYVAGFVGLRGAHMTSMLVLSNMYPPHAYGGYEMSCRDVVDRWRARGHDVTVLTTDLQIPGVDDAGSDGTHVRRTLRWYWDDHHITNPSPWRRLQMERHNHRTLRDAIERSQPEVISGWNMGAMSLGLLTTAIDTGTPIVYVVCDDWLL